MIAEKMLLWQNQVKQWKGFNFRILVIVIIIFLLSFFIIFS